MGIDAGTPFNHHGANARELALMVECGMHPLDAITAATREAADLLDLLHETGTIEPSKSADLLIVRGDPLADIGVLADPDRIAAVMSRGEWVKAPSPA
jgi:imidazolonepropionase-like amidohydrolase